MNARMNEARPLITIITVVYNGVKDMEQTMLSVLNQTYPEIEYIVIDGGSTDGTVDIIKKYEQRLAYWVSEPDKGIYYAMNKGILKATGEWIHFRNCGDYFSDADVLENFFSGSVDDQVMILHGDCRLVKGKEYCEMPPPLLKRSYKKGMPVFHPSTFVRASFHRQYPFNTLYRSSADYEFIYKALERKVKVEYRPCLVAVYNAGEGFSVTNWKLAVREIWRWKFPDLPLRNVFVEINIWMLSLRKVIAKMRRRI